MKKYTLNYQNKILLIIINDSNFFLSHRLNVALAAQNYFDVHVAYPANDKNSSIIKKLGFKTHNIFLKNYSMNPFVEICSFFSIFSLLLSLKPNFLHLFTKKPILYGSLSAIFIPRILKIIITFTGLGLSLYSKNLILIFVQKVIFIFYKIIFKSCKFFFICQNFDDLNYLIKEKIINNENSTVIRGSGVNTNFYKPCATLPKKKKIVLMASRMLWSKGLNEFICCAKLLKKYKNINFILAGPLSNSMLYGPSRHFLEQLKLSSNIKWVGFKDNMENYLNIADIVCLPTKYGEGIPKVLIEASSCGKPIISTNVNGISEVVKHNYNGLLIRPGDPVSLSKAVIKLFSNDELLQKMGKNSRTIALKYFKESIVINETLNIYKKYFV